MPAELLLKNEELVRWLLQGARAGASFEDCGALVGISGATVSTWLRKGKEAITKAKESDEEVTEKDFLYAKFAIDFEQSQSIGRVNVLQNLRDHHDWRAQVQWLARTSDQYKDVDKKQIEITGAQGGPIDIGFLIGDAVKKLDAVDEQKIIDKAADFRALEEGEVIEGHVIDD